MWNSLLQKLANDQNNGTLSNKLRKKRFDLFRKLFDSASTPVKILDVGGNQQIWEREGFCCESENIKITILNIGETEATYPNTESVVGDARNMQQFAAQEFDIVFSNSVIEHVGDYEDQRRMAEEVKRVSKRYFLQTPNKYFPIEPHFMFPMFQFFPLWLKMFLIRNFDLGWRKKISDIAEAKETVTSIRLMTKKELQELFPQAAIYEEKFLGLTKSYIAWEGLHDNEK